MNPNNQFSGNDTQEELTSTSSGARPMESPSPSPVDEPVVAPADPAPKKTNKKVIIIIASVLLVLGIATASVFVFDLLTPPEEAPTTTEGATVDEPAEEPATPVENTEQLDAEIDAIESDLNSIDDSEFSDETISDDTLQQ